MPTLARSLRFQLVFRYPDAATALATGALDGVRRRVFLETEPRQCEAFVIRRDVDGTATVEITEPGSGKRQILFVQGKPVASDSQDALSSSHQGDVTVVKLGADERYDIPDALVSGG